MKTFCFRAAIPGGRIESITTANDEAQARKLIREELERSVYGFEEVVQMVEQDNPKGAACLRRNMPPGSRPSSTGPMFALNRSPLDLVPQGPKVYTLHLILDDFESLPLKVLVEVADP